jgi:hypothetical protein
VLPDSIYASIKARVSQGFRLPGDGFVTDSRKLQEAFIQENEVEQLSKASFLSGTSFFWCCLQIGIANNFPD